MIAGGGRGSGGGGGRRGGGGGGGGGGGKDERSDWRRVLLYVRCVCFGCTGKDRQMTNFADSDNCSSPSTPEINSLHHVKDNKKRTTKPIEAPVMPVSDNRSESCSCPVIHRKDSSPDECQSCHVAGDVIAKTRHPLPEQSQVTTTTTPLQSPETTTTTATTTTIATARTLQDPRIHLDLHYLTQAFKMLDSAHLWSFNIFKLNRLTNGRSLFYLTLHLFERCDFLRVFGLDVERLMRFMTLIESNYYFSNPYHNSVHAADVVQAMFVHLSESQLESSLKPVEKMAAILSAACHDVDHRGTNQGFLLATSSPLCRLYDNVSVLENHHWRMTVAILRESRLFDHLDRPTWLRIEKLIQTMILATDITQQSAILSVFRDYLNGNNLKLSSDEQHRTFILQITLKCADISNPCRQWQLSKCWSQLICEEFFRQGDREQQLDIPVTPFCDRTQSTIAGIQTGFMTHVAEPLFVEWNRFLSTSNSTIMVENLRKNRSQWQSMANQSPSGHSDSTEGRLSVEKRRRDSSPDDFDVFTNRHSERLDNRSSSPVKGLRNLHLTKDKDSLILRRASPPPVDNNLVPNSCRHVRRPSLPHASDCQSHRKFFSLISRLDPGFENLRLDEERERRSVPRNNGSIEDTTSSSALHRIISQADDKTKNQTHARWFVEEPGWPPVTSCPSSFHGGRWRTERKLSLITAHDQQGAVTLVIGRKRSRSLVTSTLVGTFEDDPGSSGFWHVPNGEVSLEQLVVTSVSGGGMWTTWWQKKVKNSLCRSKISQPNNSDGASFCKKKGSKIGQQQQQQQQQQQHTLHSSSSNSVGHVTPSMQFLTRQCAVLVPGVLEVSFRAPKGTCRKTTSMFSTAPAAGEDAEAVPLLQSTSGCV